MDIKIKEIKKRNLSSKLLVVLIFFGFFGLTENSKAVLCTDCLSFSVSAPIAPVWPTVNTQNLQIPDNLFVTLKFPDHYLGYISDRNTWALSASTLEGLNINNFNATPVISAGTPGQFDECGVWLHGAEIIDGANKVGAWYHAERGSRCMTGSGTYTKSIAYAESTDAGASFSKVGYPNNVVLTGSTSELAAANATNIVGVGDFSVIKKDSYYYLFYLNSYKGESGVARATVSSGGVPGSWLKWYNGSFSQPGIGGTDTALGLSLAGVSYNTALQQFVGLTYGSLPTIGFKVALSPDGVNWTVLDAPLVTGGMAWDNSPTFGSNTVTPYGHSQYQTIIGPDGSKNWSDTFYIYYLYIRPGEDFSNRFMLRSEVKMKINDSPVSSPYKASAGLKRYFSSSANKHWVTSWLAVPKDSNWDFQEEADLGNVFTSAGTGLIELDDCVYDLNHYVVASGGDCGQGVTKLRTIGWVYSPASPKPANTYSIYRCYVPAMDSHFISLQSDCEGAQVEYFLGYTLNTLGDTAAPAAPTGLSVL